ncbi:hypothetical protein [Enterovibrio norvegicus]|uniref:hypothetical protein n=1 Tax=Enterovibrio norvegicus TaxID=188144 RepID=UPI000C83C177|nr:hypothetical protein [Enterovibrio norvegicus]PMH64544.1 hypothetical protein BCU62_15935 [Enterovibrio norvegicus]
MLSHLLTLQNVTLSVTTSTNGQINLAILSDNKAPLTLRFSADNAQQAEDEIIEHCINQSIVNATSVGQSIPAEAPVASQPATPAPVVNTPAPTQEQTAVPTVQENSFEDEFNL